MTTMSEWKKRAIKAENRVGVLQGKLSRSGGVDVDALNKKVKRLEQGLSIDIVAFRNSAEQLIGHLCSDLSQVILGQKALENALRRSAYKMDIIDSHDAKRWLDEVWLVRHELEASKIEEFGEEKGYAMMDELINVFNVDGSSLQEQLDEIREFVDKRAGTIGEQLFKDIFTEKERLWKLQEALEESIASPVKA